MRKCLLALRMYAKDTLQRRVMDFSYTLSLDSSIGSAAFRSTLGSTFSDTLSSSGYGASYRRGSQPVFTFNSAQREKDDDVSDRRFRFHSKGNKGKVIHSELLSCHFSFVDSVAMLRKQNNFPRGRRHLEFT